METKNTFSPRVRPKMLVGDSGLYEEGTVLDANAVEEVVDAKLASTPIILEVSVGTNAFTNVEDFLVVHNSMLNGEYIDFVIRSNFASGTRYIHRPTTVKANYISLNSKSGNCELHVNNDGSFTVSGTLPW